MVNIIKINNNTRDAKIVNRLIGVQNENNVETIKIEFDDFINGYAWLEYQKPNGEKNYILMDKENESYSVVVKNTLIDQVGNMKFNIRITTGDDINSLQVYKSKIFNLRVYETINATTEQPDNYPTWLDIANAKLIEIDEALAKIKNLDIVEYDENGDIHVKNNLIMHNNAKILGELPDTSNHVLIETATYNIDGIPFTQVEVGSEHVHMNINSIDRPTFEMPIIKEQAAYLSDIDESDITNLENRVLDIEKYKITYLLPRTEPIGMGFTNDNTEFIIPGGVYRYITINSNSEINFAGKTLPFVTGSYICFNSTTNDIDIITATYPPINESIIGIMSTLNGIQYVSFNGFAKEFSTDE